MYIRKTKETKEARLLNTMAIKSSRFKLIKPYLEDDSKVTCQCTICGVTREYIPNTIAQNTAGCRCKNSCKNRNKIMNDYGDHLEVAVKGGSFLIDKEDWYHICESYRYGTMALKDGYITCRDRDLCRSVNLHNIIMPIIDDMVVDHANRKRNDNRRSNLRYVDFKLNSRNSSLVVGKEDVGIQKIERKRLGDGYRAYINCDNVMIYLGTFDSIEEAREARIQGEIKYWGYDRNNI